MCLHSLWKKMFRDSSSLCVAVTPVKEGLLFYFCLLTPTCDTFSFNFIVVWATPFPPHHFLLRKAAEHEPHKYFLRGLKKPNANQQDPECTDYDLCKKVMRHSQVMDTTVSMLHLSSHGCKCPALTPLALCLQTSAPTLKAKPAGPKHPLLHPPL